MRLCGDRPWRDYPEDVWPAVRRLGPKVPGHIEAVWASGRERDGIPVEPALLEALWPDGRS